MPFTLPFQKVGHRPGPRRRFATCCYRDLAPPRALPGAEPEKTGQTGVLYHGLEVLGGGAILAGLILGAIGVFIIDRQFMRAAAFALAGAALTFFGFMHGEKIGVGQTPVVAISYLAVAAVLASCSKLSFTAPAPAKATESHGELPEPAS
jgi:adenine/guanine/hypoxanthine permease